MSSAINRRFFMQTGVGATAALTIPTTGAASWAASATEAKKLTIHRAKEIGKTPEEELDALAIQLTRQAVDALGGMSRFVAKGDLVWVKPNMGWDRRPEQAANTNPAVVATLIEMAYEAGAGKVKVSDNTCSDERKSYKLSGIDKAAATAGAEVLFHDKRKYRKIALDGAKYKSWELYTEIVEADKIINCPVAKDHTIAGLTLAIKNLMGIMGGNRGQVHQDLGAFLADLAKFLQPKLSLTVIDAMRIMTGSGPRGGNLADVARRDTIVAGTDFVAADAYGVTLFENRDVNKIMGIKESEALGLGTTDYASLAPKPVLVG